MTILYGIPNCDTVKKARQWLATHHVTYQFYDLKKSGITRPTLNNWIDKIGMDSLINRRGTTWRMLSETKKNSLDKNAYIKLICKYPTLIKRPVIDTGAQILVGFDQEKYKHVFSK